MIMAIEKIIDSKDLLSNFMPEESALIGFHFGRQFYKNKVSVDSFDFAWGELPGEYIIKMIERNRNIIFSKKNSAENFTLSASTMFDNNRLLRRFNSIQSCYIGILAGIESHKSTLAKEIKCTKVVGINEKLHKF